MFGLKPVGGVNASSPNHPITANGIINNVNYTNKPSIQTEVTLNIDNNSVTSTTYPIEVGGLHTKRIAIMNLS